MLTGMFPESIILTTRTNYRTVDIIAPVYLHIRLIMEKLLMCYRTVEI